MKRKRGVLLATKIYEDEFVKINLEGGIYFFEIFNESTSDIAEAVALMIRLIDSRNKVWNVELPDLDYDYDIVPHKALFWLSGGKKEWDDSTHYLKEWKDVYHLFDEEYGDKLITMVSKSSTLGDIRKHFMKKLNLSIMYNFALKNKLVN